MGSSVLLIMSQSATAALATGVEIAFALFFVPLRGKIRALARVFLLASLLLFAVTMLSALRFDPSVSGLVGRSDTLTGRTALWAAVTHAVGQRPLAGYGYGFWAGNSSAKFDIWRTVHDPAPHAHSEWLDLLLQVGFIGLALMAICWLVAICRAIRPSANSSQAFFCGLILANLLTRSIAETILIDPVTVNWIWFLPSYFYLAHAVPPSPPGGVDRRTRQAIFFRRPAFKSRYSGSSRFTTMSHLDPATRSQ
jgi:O-antigen ligase